MWDRLYGGGVVEGLLGVWYARQDSGEGWNRQWRVREGYLGDRDIGHGDLLGWEGVGQRGLLCLHHGRAEVEDATRGGAQGRRDRRRRWECGDAAIAGQAVDRWRARRCNGRAFQRGNTDGQITKLSLHAIDGGCQLVECFGGRQPLRRGLGGGRRLRSGER